MDLKLALSHLYDRAASDKKKHNVDLDFFIVSQSQMGCASQKKKCKR